MNKLPDKLSELLTVALDDLRKVERSKKYVVNMSDWHSPYDGVCEVCLAGAVMAKTLETQHNENIHPGCFSEDIAQKLDALNELRIGKVGWALWYLSGQSGYNGHTLDRNIPKYEQDRKGFYRELRKLARDLKAEGL